MLIQREDENGPRGDLFSMDELLLGTDPFAFYGNPNSLKKEPRGDNANPYTAEPLYIRDFFKPSNDAHEPAKPSDAPAKQQQQSAAKPSQPPAKAAAPSSPKPTTSPSAARAATGKCSPKPAAKAKPSNPAKKKKFERPKIVYRRRRLDLDTDEYRERAQALLSKDTDIILQKRKDAFFQLLKQLCPYIVVERSGSRTLRTYLVDTRRKKRYRTYSDAIKGGALDPLIVETGTTVLLKGCVDEAQRRFAVLKRQAAEKKKQEENEKANASTNGAEVQQKSAQNVNSSNAAAANPTKPVSYALSRPVVPHSREPAKQSVSKTSEESADSSGMTDLTSGRMFKRKREEGDGFDKLRSRQRIAAPVDPVEQEQESYDLTFPEFYNAGDRNHENDRLWYPHARQQSVVCEEFKEDGWPEGAILLDVEGSEESGDINSAFSMFDTDAGSTDDHQWFPQTRGY